MQYLNTLLELDPSPLKICMDSLECTVAAKKKATHKMLDAKNRDSLVAKFFSNARSLLVTLYFWNYVKSFSRLPSGLKLFRMEQNNFT